MCVWFRVSRRRRPPRSEAGPLGRRHHDQGDGEARRTAEFFARFDVTLPAGTSAECCVDWTEHRHHLAGAPGRGVLTMSERRRWLEPTVRRQALKLTVAGRTAPEERLGVDLSDEFAA